MVTYRQFRAAKAPAKGPLHQPLHDPGRYLAGIGLVDPGPHFQVVIALPASADPAAAVEPKYGVRSMVLLSMFVASIARAVTVTLPVPSVATACTYLDPLPLAISNPRYARWECTR